MPKEPQVGRAYPAVHATTENTRDPLPPNLAFGQNSLPPAAQPHTPQDPLDYDNAKIEIEKELEKDLEAQATLSIALNDLNLKLVKLRHEIATLNTERAKLRSTMDKSRYTISLKRLQIKRLTDQFWASKR